MLSFLSRHKKYTPFDNVSRVDDVRREISSVEDEIAKKGLNSYITQLECHIRMHFDSMRRECLTKNISDGLRSFINNREPPEVDNIILSPRSTYYTKNKELQWLVNELNELQIRKKEVKAQCDFTRKVLNDVEDGKDPFDDTDLNGLNNEESYDS